MKTVGIIAEYNPFHNGHKFHIEEAKRLTGADFVIVIMSGNYVQRGTPAIIPKHLRSKSALLSGASLVIELPVSFATGTAEQFAYGAVSLLEKLGCVDALCFGSECGEINLLQRIADILTQEPESYKDLLQSFLKQGLSFPAARSAALGQLFPTEPFASLLDKPNNILGIEYLKSLKRTNSTIKPITIMRQGADYHSENLQGDLSSATAIRNLLETDSLSSISNVVPASTISILEDTYVKRYPITANDFSLLLKFRLLSETKQTLTTYADVSEELANRIYKQLNQYESFEQFCELLKTKELTYTRISRALLHILLNIKKNDSSDIEYARILGFSKKDVKLMNLIKQQSSIPLISRLTATNELSDHAKHTLETEIRVSNLYESVVSDKFKTPFINEYEHPIVRI